MDIEVIILNSSIIIKYRDTVSFPIQPKEARELADTLIRTAESIELGQKEVKD